MATFTEDLTDGLSLSDKGYELKNEIIASEISHADTFLDQKVLRQEALDECTITEIVIDRLIFQLFGSDDITLTEEFLASATYNIAYEDLCTSTDDGNIARLSFLSTSDSLSISESTIASAVYNISVSDLITGGFSLDLFGFRYDAEVIRTEDYNQFDYDGYVFEANNFAASKYKGWNFNSFAKVNGQYYGCSSDGIYLLSGQTDNGKKIKSVVSTGNVKIAGGLQTRLEKAYLTIKNSGKVTLSVVVDGDVMYNYQLVKFNNYTDQARVTVGKGLKSVVWRFELTNEDGADFDLDNLAVLPVVLTRRKV